MKKEDVYLYLQKIPRGKVATYGSIAAALGSPGAARAVGQILHRNPDGDLYPCYKVVSADGRLSEAYAFGGMDAQRRRLEAEGIKISGGRVDLKRYLYTDAKEE